MGTAAAPVVDDGSTGRGDVRFGGGERIESDGRFGRRSEGAIRQDVLGAFVDIAIFIGVRFSVRFLLISRVDCLFLEKTIGAVHLLISSWGVFLAAAVAAAIAHCVGCRNGDCWSSMNGRGVDGGWGGGGEAPVLEIEELEVHESPGVQLDGLL